MQGDTPGTGNMGELLNGMVVVILILLIAACSVAGYSVITLLLTNGTDVAGNAFVRFLVLATHLGGTAALVRAGSMQPMSDPVTALQSLSVVAGIIFGGIVSFFPTAFWLLVEGNPSSYPSLHVHAASVSKSTNVLHTGEGGKEGGGDSQPCDEISSEPVRTDWSVSMLAGFMDVFETLFSFFKIPLPPVEEFLRFGIALFFPYTILPVAYSRIHTSKYTSMPASLVLLAVWMFFWWWLFVCAHIIEAAPYWCGINYGNCNPAEKRNGSEGWWSIGWTSYILFVCAVATCRHSTRRIYNIPGAIWLDFVVSLFFYPLVICQISAQEIVVTDDPTFVQQANEPTQSVPLQHGNAAQDGPMAQYSTRDVQVESRMAGTPSLRPLYAAGPATPTFGSQPNSAAPHMHTYTSMLDKPLHSLYSSYSSQGRGGGALEGGMPGGSAGYTRNVLTSRSQVGIECRVDARTHYLRGPRISLQFLTPST